MEMVEHDGQITYVLDSGNKVSFNREYVTEVGKALGRLYRLEKAFKRVMDIPSDEVAEIVEAYADGRLTVWPREGQELWYDAKGMCEECPKRDTCDMNWDSRCPGRCPSYPYYEHWRECYRTDPDEVAYLVNGDYYKTKAECEAAIAAKEGKDNG